MIIRLSRHELTLRGGSMEASPVIPEAIRTLVQSFEFHQAAYKRGQFNETQLRREFIDPFFKALGWDIDNNKRYSELYKEVIHEDPIRIRGSTEFIDYSFRIGGARKFIVEAKKPGVNIKDDSGPALQIRRYAWNARLPLSILTDFEEFAVYDCTMKPMPGDTAATARIAYFTYKEYSEKWGWIASIFSQDSILQGSFDRFAEGTKGKKGTATVDEAILADIEEWRDALAKNLALRNPALTVDELNVAVQRTIDRILFLRICEDRGIEQYGCLQQLLEGQDVYQRLMGLFQRADTKYNSGIFHFAAESGWDELPDTLTPSLIIDDAVLKKIIKRLYYPDSPYEFSVISPVILGQVYEQFLGKVIRLTSGHQARVEYKPEMKKAGGVYYTPQYIVDYIVKHTIGELVKNKTPREAAKLRILDPACGSGSFLIGAYQYLLDWHLEYYIHNLVPVLADKPATSLEVQALLPEQIPRSGKKNFAGDTSLPIYKSANGSSSRTRSDWKLTIVERKRILLNNIFGVDIDTQAVEVTKLSLLLKVLEEESEENVSKQLKLFEERALPSLHKNIKCGNSLIGTDIYADVQATLDDSEVVKRINAFDWEREFPEIMQRGGFDVVIGNPPYVRQESIIGQKEYFGIHYEAYQGTADLYVYFIERGLSLLRPKGLFSYIVANKWIRATYGKPLRRFLLTKQIEEIIDFGDLPVFKAATTYPCIIRISNEKPLCEFNTLKFDTLNFISLDDYIISHGYLIDQRTLTDDGWSLADVKTDELLKKIHKKGLKLEKYVNGSIYRGITTGLNKAFIINEETYQSLIQKNLKNSEIIKPFIFGKEIKRYLPPITNKYLIFTRRGIDIKQFPDIEEYLKQYKTQLLPKPDNFNNNDWPGRKPGNYEWFEIQDSTEYYREFDKPKIILPDISTRGNFAFDVMGGFFCANTAYIIISDDKFLLGILNSKLVTYYYQHLSSSYRGGYLRFIHQYLNQIPIYNANYDNPTDKARHDKMVALVERMLALHKQKADVKTDHDKNLVERQIEATDKQIDALVYDLYGLTSEEIQIVERGTK